jgi:hypothetical protein
MKQQSDGDGGGGGGCRKVGSSAAAASLGFGRILSVFDVLVRGPLQTDPGSLLGKSSAGNL